MTKRAFRRYAYDMGKVRCSSCGKSEWSNKGVCACGNPHARIDLWYENKTHYFFKSNDGMPLDYKEAVALLGKIQTELDDCRKKDIPFDVDKYKEVVKSKLATKLDEYITHKELQLDRKRIHPSSLKSINYHIKMYIRPAFEHINEEELTKSIISNWLDNLPRELKRKTRMNIYITFKSFINWMGHPVQLPKIDEDDDSDIRQALTYDEQQEALQRIPERHRDIIEFGMETGLRPGEIVTLQSIDFNPMKGTLWVRRTLSGGEVIETTKGGSRVEISLSDRAHDIARKNAGGAWLFVHPYTNDRYGINALNKIWKKYSKSHVSFYEASRHSFISQLVDDGVSSLQIKTLARHSDIRTTQRYSHPMKGKDALNSRGRVIPFNSDATLTLAPQSKK